MPGTGRFRYSRWDGTQVGFELDADDVFAEITDDLLYHGDLQRGAAPADAAGLRGPQRRADAGASARCSRSCRAAAAGPARAARPRRRVRRHRRGAARGRRHGARTASTTWPARRRESGDAAPPGDHRPGRAGAQHCSSTCCRPTSPARSASCRSTSSPRARPGEQFEELIDQLRQQLMQSYFNQMSGAMAT